MWTEYCFMCPTHCPYISLLVVPQFISPSYYTQSHHMPTHNHPPPTATHCKVLLSVGAKEEEPKPAKRHKPLFTCEKTTSEPTSQACSSNCETSLSQESIVSPPLPIAALHTSSASSSLLASPLEPPSSQHTMVRWGPMSPAFLIKGQSLAALNLL